MTLESFDREKVENQLLKEQQEVRQEEDIIDENELNQKIPHHRQYLYFRYEDSYYYTILFLFYLYLFRWLIDSIIRFKVKR